jgi:DNA-binding CsgD family transcriptional regulator
MNQQTDALAASAQDIVERVSALSDRQRQALQLRARGLSCREAAACMNLGYDAYKDLCFRGREKLLATTTAEAVAVLAAAETAVLRLAVHRARQLLQHGTQEARRALAILDGAMLG